MNCDLVRQELTALDRGELSAAAADTVTRHVAGCSPCASELRRLRRVRALFVSTTAIAPSVAGSSRLMAAVDDAIAAGRQARGEGGGGRVLDLWSRFRHRYEQSAAVRRFTVASIGIHAAAAAILAVALSTGGGASRPEAVITIDGPAPTAFEDSAFGDHAPLPAGLREFDAATADGVRGTSGRAFPNATAAARLGVVCDPREAALALRETMGPDAEAVAAATARGLAWLAASQRDDGGFGSSEDTALVIQAHAAAGHSSVGDDALGRAVAVLETDVLRAEVPLGARADGVRALVHQFGVDFDRLPAAGREARRALLVRAGRSLAESQRADGGFAAADVSGTAAVTVALADLRAFGVLDTGTQLVAAQAWFDRRRSQDGLVLGAVGSDPAAISAALLDVEAGLGRVRVAPAGAVRIAERAASSTSLDSAAAGIAALRAVGAPVRDAVRRVARAQTPDGSFAQHGRGTRVAATASGVVAMARAVR